MALKSILTYKDDLCKMPRHLQWDEIQVGETYHFPPIISLPRKDIRITRKDATEDVIFYNVIGDTKKEELKFASSSILSRFIIKKHSY